MDLAPGNKNLITDIPGIQVGHAEDNKIGTGVTVITGDKPFTAAVDVRGGGPGTRETDMLSLENSIGRADAIVLSGGSAFGLDACSEVQDLLRQDNKGYKVGKAVVPLVPGAVIFDLNLNDIGKQSILEIAKLLFNLRISFSFFVTRGVGFWFLNLSLTLQTKENLFLFKGRMAIGPSFKKNCLAVSIFKL